MKVQKIGLNFKINSAKGKDISSSKALSRKEDELHISRDARDLQDKSKINQTCIGPCLASNLSNVDKLNFTYSKQKIETKNTNNLKSSQKLTSSGSVPVDTGKTPAFTLDIREEKIKEAKIKLAQGYYSRAEVYSKVAERIIDILI